MKKFQLTLLLALTALGASAQKTITAQQAKLVGDGKTVNTVAIQNAIDRLSQKGGGTLVLTYGEYVTGTIELKSNVELRIEKGATLLGSVNIDDYQDVTKEGDARKVATDYRSFALIESYNAENIKITGGGVINGRGRELALAIDSLHLSGKKIDKYYFERLHRPREVWRPNLFTLSNSKNIEVAGVRCQGSACWGLLFFKCENLKIHDIDVWDRDYWNNDGIDIVDCHHVEIYNTHVDAADDGLCLKSDDPNDTNDDIYIHDCQVETSASGIKFGTNSFGGFQNIKIERVKIKNTFRSAIAIEGVDGGIIKNVLVQDIEAYNTGNPIFIRLGKRHGERTAVVDGITIRRLYCWQPFERPDEGYDMRGPIEDTMINPVPSSITGIPGAKVKNVTIEDVTLVYPGGASKGLRYIPLWDIKQVPEKEKNYPEFDMFGELPAYGFYVRHADGITFRNVNLKLENGDFRPAFVLDDASNVSFDNITYPLGHTVNQIYDSSKANNK